MNEKEIRETGGDFNRLPIARSNTLIEFCLVEIAAQLAAANEHALAQNKILVSILNVIDRTHDHPYPAPTQRR